MRHGKTWARLLLLVTGLVLFASFAPISDRLDTILTGVFLVIRLAYLSAHLWESWHERQVDRAVVGQFLISWILPPALALGLLSLGTIAPISDLWDKIFSWIAFAVLLAYLGVPMWEYHREAQTDQSSSDAITSGDQI